MPSIIRSSLVTAAALAVGVTASPLSTNPSYTNTQRTALDLAPLSEETLHGHIDDAYIVTLKNDVPVSLMTNHMNFLESAHEYDPLQGDASGVKHIYNSHVLKGYAGHFTEDVVSQIRRMPEVAHVERDQIVKTLEYGNSTTQKGAPWVSHKIITPNCEHVVSYCSRNEGSCAYQSHQETRLWYIQ
jgi:cerevisin